MPEPQQQSSADNAVHVVGPDGKHYKFPAGTTRDKAVEYFKKKGVSKTATPKAATPPKAPTGDAGMTRKDGYLTAPGGTPRKIEAGLGLGALDAFGLKPPVEGDPASLGFKDAATQMYGNIAEAAKQGWKEMGPLAPVDMIAMGIEGTLRGVGRGVKQIAQGVSEGDAEKIARGTLGGGASLGMTVEGAKGAAGKGLDMVDAVKNLPNVPIKTIFSMEKMQSLMDEYVHGAGLDLKETFKKAYKSVNSEIERHAKALDNAIPKDAIDATKIYADAMKAIDDVVKTPGKYPQELQQIAQSIKNHPPGKWDFETAKQFRTNINAAMERSSGPMKAGLTETYKNITDAMKKAATSVPGGGFSWNFYNELTRKFHQQYSDFVNGVLDADSGAKVSGHLLRDRVLSREVIREMGKYGLDTTKVSKFLEQAEKIVKAKKFYGNSLFRLAYGTKAGAAGVVGGYMAGAGHMGAVGAGALAGLSSIYLKNLKTLMELDPSIVDKVMKDRELPKPGGPTPVPQAASPGTPPAAAPGTPPTPGAAPAAPAPKIQPLTAAQKLALRAQAKTSQSTASAGTPTGPGAKASTTGSPSAESPAKTQMEIEREELLKKAGEQVAKTTNAFAEAEKQAKAASQEPTVTKVPEGEFGNEQERLKAKNRERKAKQREKSVRTEVKGAGDKIAAGAAGHAQLTEDLPTIEIEKNLEGDSPEGKTLVSALRKMGKTQKWDDDVYRGHLLEAVKGYEKRIAKKRSSQ